MADLVVPRLGVTVTEVEIIEWLIDSGATVAVGDPVVTVSTDKAEVEIEATSAGVLYHEALPGETHPVGAMIGVIEEPGVG